MQPQLQPIVEILRQIARDIVQLLPKVALSVLVLTAALIAIKAVNTLLSKLLKFAEVDQLIKQYTGIELPFSSERLLIALADIGIALVAVYSVLSMFLTQAQMQVVESVLGYGTRLISVALMLIFIFVAFNSIVEKIRVEAKLRSYIMFILLLLSTALIVDVTTLSKEVKGALVTGLSIGIGLSIGVFTAWFFFKEYLDTLVEARARREEKQPREAA
ncbi:MAG: hypothetical protein DRN96_06500 [Thermoproteota archaeon]|nr:MAG: hypothetical protein DRN96_06500 [Candidatus Korarchaeota archaeon]RLG55870.1 MAG: hypothetical protein DRN99_01400 [Candidatus Korarchaeota archaeon]